MSSFTNWWRTVGVLVGLELRQRTRTTRWRILLGVFFLVVSLVVFGSLWFATAIDADSRQDWDANLYSIVLGFVGFLGLVIAPTMTATSINGDRKDATLAVVQATPASGWQLAAGKLLAAWIASCALLVVSSPYLIWGIIEANYPVAFSLLGIVVVAALFLTYCGIGLGFSALFARPIGSAAVTQLAMLFLLIGLPITSAMLVPATETQVAANRPTSDYNEADKTWTCRVERTEVSVTHTERIWWIIAPNPAVVLADAAAQQDVGRRSESIRYADYSSDGDVSTRPPSESVLGALAEEISEFRTPPNPVQDRACGTDGTSFSRTPEYHTDGYLGHTWYLGLLANLALGGIGLAFAARRLRVPAGTLPRGVRIA